MSKPKKRILFIINPVSGVYKKDHIPRKIDKHLDKEQFEPTIRFTEYAGHARTLAEGAVKEGVEIVVAVGGDGSINEVAQSLVGSETILGLIPCGSGNGLGTHLHIPPRRVKAAIDILNTGKVVPMDVVKSNLRYFVSNAGFGIDSSVARRFRHHRYRGFFSYAGAVIKELLIFFKPQEAMIEIDGVALQRRVYLLTAFNANQYGYGFGVFPSTSLNDGLMNVILLSSFPYYKLLYVVVCLILKKPEWIREAECFMARRVVIRGNRKMNYQFDGDSVIYHEDVTFEVEPKSIGVIVPQELEVY